MIEACLQVVNDGDNEKEKKISGEEGEEVTFILVGGYSAAGKIGNSALREAVCLPIVREGSFLPQLLMGSQTLPIWEQKPSPTF